MRLRRSRFAAMALVAMGLLIGCGGGGGGSGGTGSGGTGGLSPVSFLGFGFRTPGGEETETPPFEAGTGSVTSVGAPLNLEIIFHFDGLPAGPFNATSLPVFTTPAEVTPLAGALASTATIPAKGSYTLELEGAGDGASVVFSPFVPTAVLQIALSAPAESVPGLLPGSIYTAAVSVVPGQGISNLTGAGGSVQFGTTSNAAAFYPTDPADAEAPSVVSSVPADGGEDFYPGAFSSVALATGESLFPPGASNWVLSFDKALQPTGDNLFGRDVDKDGLIEPTFFARAQSTQLIVSQLLPANVIGVHPEAAILSGYDAGSVVDLSGGDVFLQENGGPVSDAQGGLQGVPSSLAVGRGGQVVWLVIPREGDTDLLAVADHVLGDPSFAALGVESADGPAAAVDTGISSLVGLVELAGGRLLGFDEDSRRVVELKPILQPHPTAAGGQALEPAELLGLEPASEAVVFQSETWPSGAVVLDLAQAPSGRFFALVRDAGNATAAPGLVELAQVDPDQDGVFEGGEGLPLAGVGDPVYVFPVGTTAVEFVGEHLVVILDRVRDALARVDLVSASSTDIINGLGAFGIPLASFPEGLSPAVAFGVGFADLDLAVSLKGNSTEGAVVQLDPVGVLPIDAVVTVMQRNLLTSLFGTNLLNASPEHPVSALGATEVLSVRTAAPIAGSSLPVDDVFLEDFETTALEDTSPLLPGPQAHWGLAPLGAAGSGGLRASVGLPQAGTLGDFRPLPDAEYSPAKGYVKSSASTGDPSLDFSKADYHLVLLNTDSQAFPLSDGSTPGVTQASFVLGGEFGFRDFIIPEGVHVVVKGSRPLRIVATGRVEIRGVLDVRGVDGASDDTFNSGFLPVPGGPGGPGAGRGGDGHPTRFDPAGSGAIDQYVTPETGEHGFGPVVGSSGVVTIQQVGGRGGLSTLGYDPSGTGIPKLDEMDNREEHRPPGGGGGSFYSEGDQAHQGTGSYLVQSESTWFPYDKCTLNDKVRDALYGNDERLCAGFSVNPLQCVYMVGTPEDPNRFFPGGLPGSLVFTDGVASNDYIGPGGELPGLIGGQGGGAGGSRIDSMRHRLWAIDSFGSCDPLGPPFYPALQSGLNFSPTLFDAKGGAGGGGGGSVMIQCYGDIVIGRTGHISARGGHGGGGEVVQNSNFSGGGGGGSGGAVILQAAGDVIMEADSNHRVASYVGAGGTQGASIEVSGGFGRDARSRPDNEIDFIPMSYDFTRSDGGQGGMGLVQLQSGADTALPRLDQGSYVFAKRRTVLKLGKWTGDFDGQEQHPTWENPPNSLPPDELRYIEMLHYRYFSPDGVSKDRYMVLNGTFPPVIESDDGDNGHSDVNEYPAGSGQLWFDTPMMSSEDTSGMLVVREPQPEWVMREYAGYDPATFLEPNWQTNTPPGVLYSTMDVLPLCIVLNEPDGTPPKTEVDGNEVYVPGNLEGRLPLIHPSLVPAPFGTVSRGTSVWLDFAGAQLRSRSLNPAMLGRTPPFFMSFHGTQNSVVANAGSGQMEGEVLLGAPVPSGVVAAHYVLNAGVADPGLFNPPGAAGPVPFNDIKVDAPDQDIGLENVVSDNAIVTVLFQGAYATRVGSHVPDESSLSPWVSDLTSLSGFPLIRFQVAFDLGSQPAEYPFGLQSWRPQVDYLRLRASY